MAEKSLIKKESVFGAVYEKLTDKEIRKSMGMFYTPDFIIDYILKNTVYKVDVLKNPFVKVLDPACGAGYFLIKAYDMLKEKFINNLDILRREYADENYYIQENNESDVLNVENKYSRLKEIKGIDYWVEENLNYHILTNCLYGADLDPIAVSITKKNLMDKGNTKVDLTGNMVQCDSLIRWEDADFDDRLNTLNNILKNQQSYKVNTNLSEEDKYKIIFDLSRFWSNQFDYIIGNPPYVMLLKSEIDEGYWKYILSNYKTLGYKKNTFYLLMERSLDKLKPGGMHGFIIPDRYFLSSSYIKSRINLFKNTRVVNVTQLSSKIFEEAIVGTAVYIVEKNKYKENHVIDLRLNYTNENNYCYSEILQKDIEKNGRYTLNILTKSNCKNVVEKIKGNSLELKDFCNIHVGMMIRDKNRNFKEAESKEEKSRIVLGRDLDKYIVENEERYCFVDGLEIFGGTKNLQKHNMHPKILLRKTGNNIIASIDNRGVFAEQSVYMIIPFNENKIYSLLGQIQSNISNFYFKEYLITNPDAYPYIQHYDVERIPIHEDILNNDYYSKLIKKIIYIKKEIKNITFDKVIRNNDYTQILEEYIRINNKQEKLESELHFYIEESNQVLFKAYRLTDEEIDLIKSRTNNSISKEDTRAWKIKSQKISKYKREQQSKYYVALINEICLMLKKEVVRFLESSDKYLSIEDFEKELSNTIINFHDLMKILREYKFEREDSRIIRELLNTYSDSYNKYLKNKEINTQGKELVKYSRNEYGLSSWSSEIHNSWLNKSKSN